MSVLVFVEDAGELAEQALTFARGLNGEVDAIAFGAAPAVTGVGTLHVAEIDGYAPQAWARAIASLQPTTVVAAGSDRGNEVLAHAAAMTGGVFAANVVRADGDAVTRQRWGGSLLEEARLHGSIKLLTLAPHALTAEASPTRAEVGIRQWSPALAEKDFRVRIIPQVEADTGKISLAQARVVVGGGRGVGSAEGFASLEELAGLLGGAVGCSRAVTSLGWRPHADQVGQTGTRIAPDLYIACGISGAIQHMVGCRAAKHILAINTDAAAPIVAQADYAVVGDVQKVLSAVNAQIRKVKSA